MGEARVLLGASPSDRASPQTGGCLLLANRRAAAAVERAGERANALARLTQHCIRHGIVIRLCALRGRGRCGTKKTDDTRPGPRRLAFLWRSYGGLAFVLLATTPWNRHGGLSAEQLRQQPPCGLGQQQREQQQQQWQRHQHQHQRAL